MPAVGMPVDRMTAHLQRLREAYPDLALDPPALRFMRGQSNDVLLVGREFVFRFPRSPQAAQILAAEAALLRALRGRLPLPVPDPTYVGADPRTGRPGFVGYRLIPGEPLTPASLRATAGGEALHRMASQLAAFLRALHGVPVGEFGLVPPVVDGREAWTRLYARFRVELFRHMRPDARDGVARRFEAFLAEPSHFAFRPVLRHGDFGGGNILHDLASGEVTGVIDFGAAGMGDPAVDLAALSWYGELFLGQFFSAYPELAAPDVRARARFYRSTHALQQALWALETGDEAEFADGITAYV